ncbi:MAG: STAS domain-containing protein [Candidatus Solibacter sp.]|jgi:anti-anti-sigma regulatory factor
MTTHAVWIQEAVEKVNGAQSEVIVDFSAVPRIDGNAVRALEELAALADAKSVKVVLRAVNVDIYRVLKLMKLTGRFSFLT